MNYKSVLEEQIDILQKRQKSLSEQAGYEKESCEIARTIIQLISEANNYSN